jgi:CheY-like chemotaxis protein
MALSERPDIIIMGLDMPVVDGWEATHRLKSNSVKAIPIIALSAHAISGSREKALAARCDEYEPKPVDFEQLIKKVQFLAK